MKLQTSTQEKSKDFEPVHIPEGIYVAELKEVKDVSEGTYGARVAFIYNIVEHNKELALVAYKSKATRNNKIGQTLIAHGLEINDEEVDTDAILGSKVRVWVEDFEKEFETEGKTEKKKSSIISKVKPLEEKVTS